MQYMMIYRAKEKNMLPTQQEMAEMGKYVEDMAKTGVLVVTGGLLPSAKGTRVRLDSGKLTVTDGPFTEAKEMIGGFAIVEVNSREEAVELAGSFLRVAGDGESEIREMHGWTSFAKP